MAADGYSEKIIHSFHHLFLVPKNKCKVKKIVKRYKKRHLRWNNVSLKRATTEIATTSPQEIEF